VTSQRSCPGGNRSRVGEKWSIDARGIIRFKDLRDEELEEAVEKLLAEIDSQER